MIMTGNKKKYQMATCAIVTTITACLYEQDYAVLPRVSEAITTVEFAIAYMQKVPVDFMQHWIS
jgi:energy-converting hydrogenase Eha subunit C